MFYKNIMTGFETDGFSGLRSKPVWSEKNRQMSIKVAQEWFN